MSESSAERCEVVLLNPCRYADVAARGLRPWLMTLLEAVAPGATSFGVRFVSDREMQRLNREFRAQDATTDVLSFPGEHGSEDGGSAAAVLDGEAPGWHLGDVVISVPAARRQAQAAGHELARELRILLLHGVLHCLGHDHETDDGAMERIERGLRARFIAPVGRRSGAQDG